VIVTVTPNPSVDRTYVIDELRPGAMHRAEEILVEPGGKGLNVAVVLATAGHDVRAVVPLGGHDGELLRDEVTARGVRVTAVPIAHTTRTNVAVVTPDGSVTKFNAPGPVLSADESRALTKATVAALDGAAWVAGCGSLPPGTTDAWYADLVVEAHAAGARVAIDSSGAPLATAVAAGPDLLKPNREELAEVTGRDIHTLGDVVAAAEQLRARGVAIVVASLGADGAVLVDADGAWHATRPPIEPVSAVGAGDSTLAGILGAGASGPDALRAGVAHGAAAALLPGTTLPRPSDLELDAVNVRRVDPTHPLTEGAHR
jgi:1-phosphofructokinase